MRIIQWSWVFHILNSFVIYIVLVLNMCKFVSMQLSNVLEVAKGIAWATWTHELQISKM